MTEIFTKYFEVNKNKNISKILDYTKIVIKERFMSVMHTLERNISNLLTS